MATPSDQRTASAPITRDPCAFCSNPRTNKRGEHVWDNWINAYLKQLGSKGSTVHMRGIADEPIRSFRTDKLSLTAGVVCDSCNHGWMSLLSQEAKQVLEGAILHDRPTVLTFTGAVTVASFAFMKAVVLDQQHARDRSPRIRRPHRQAFRRARQYCNNTGLPSQLQVSLLHYRRTRVMEAYAMIDEIEIAQGPNSGYRIPCFTYVVGALALQVTYPVWLGKQRAPPGTPTVPDMPPDLALPIWPHRADTHWPPARAVSSASLDFLRRRFILPE